MNSDHWNLLTQGNTVKQFRQGDIILAKDQPFSTLYFIKSGLVRVDIDSSELSSVIFRGPGDVIGELEFISYKNGFVKNAQAALIAEENCELAVLPYQSIISILSTPSNLTIRFYYILCCLLASISQQYLYYYSETKLEQAKLDKQVKELQVSKKKHSNLSK